MKKYCYLLLFIIITLILGACNANSSLTVEPIQTISTQFESTIDITSITETTMVSTELVNATSSLITTKPEKPTTLQTSISTQIKPTTTSKINETTTEIDLIETTTQFTKPNITIEETTTNVTQPTKKCNYKEHESYIITSYDQNTDTIKRYCQLCDFTEYVPIQPISIQLKSRRLHIYGGYYARATCYITDEKGRREYELDGWPASLSNSDYSGYYFLLAMDKSNEGMIIEIYVSDRSGRNATATYQIVQTEDQNYTTVLI